MAIHSTHKTRVSFDSSSFDEICTKCGATDIAGGGWGKLEQPCPIEETLIINTPYGEVSGPESAIKYIQELIDDDTKPPFFY